MSDKPTEAAPAAASPKKLDKILMILLAVTLVITLANTVLLILNPTAKKVEHFNEELKTEMAESIALIHKKIDGLRSAEAEWQSVLKKASAKPDAVYKVVNTKDGYLTLTEISPSEAAPAGEK